VPAEAAELIITDRLHRRGPGKPDYVQEKVALQELAHLMADNPSEVLPRLVELAMRMSDAESAGISLLEPATETFRWMALAGKFQVFEGATTPRYDSPCGVCLDQARPILMQHPEREYAWIREAGLVVPEVLLVPLLMNGKIQLGTLWVIARDGKAFNDGDARILTELAVFSGIALQVIQTERNLTRALEQQETLTEEMGHRVKNLFAIADGMVRASARGATTPAEMAKNLSGRLHALADANALVHRSFDPDGVERSGAELSALIVSILKPYGHSGRVAGPEVKLGNNSTNAIALVFHELATNSAKYGALGAERGEVSVEWNVVDGVIQLSWQESGGPAISTIPTRKGFGSTLVERTVCNNGGAIDFDWQPAGARIAIAVPLASLQR
jgi:two-component sensor histidine kinase